MDEKPLAPTDPALRSQAKPAPQPKQRPEQMPGYDADFGRILTPGEAAMLKALNL